MRELAGSPIDDNSYEIMVLQGLRALLGEDKAQRAMVDLQSKSAASCEQVMAEAQARYDALSPEQKEAPSKILSQVVASSVKLRLKMAGKKLTNIRFTSIPKILKGFFIKQ